MPGITHRSELIKILPRIICFLLSITLCAFLQASFKDCKKCNKIYDDDMYPSCPFCGHVEDSLANQSPEEAAAAPASPDTTVHDQHILATEMFLALAQSNPNANFVLSQYTVASALSLIIGGASEEARKTVRRYLRGADQSERGCGLSSTQGATCCASNCLAVSERHLIREEFRNQAGRLNSRILERLDFTDAEVVRRLVKEINDYINKLTEGMITACCDESSFAANPALMIWSVLYFKGKWCTPFELFTGTFDLPNGVTIEDAQMMTVNLADLDHAEVEGWHAVSVPYHGGYEMILILPPEDTMPTAITPQLVDLLINALSPNPILTTINMPPYNTSTEIDFTEYLASEQTGLGMLFQSGSDALSEMVSTFPPVFISGMRQRNTLEVDREGTRGASVMETVFADGPSSTPPTLTLNFNRSFYYMLRHSETGEVLFAGQLCNPYQD